jgi:hypothetical protein
MKLLRHTIEFALLAGVSVATAELAARVDDRIRIGVPITHTTDETVDLRVVDSAGFHGRPHGRYHQFALNNFGFRGPDMTPRPAPGCTRILVLGASETMGYYETSGKEYPAQLRDSLRSYGCYEVVNAGIPGMSLKSIITFWNAYANRFGAAMVLVYASPVFYLSNDVPGWPHVPVPPPAQASAPFRPRLIERAQNVIETPDFLQRRRVERWIARDTRDKPASWYFQAPPQDRIQEFMRDLDSLGAAIRHAGAQPVVMTHAMRFSIPSRPEDDFLLLAWRRYTPRATAETMLTFERAVADSMRAAASKRRAPIVDIDSALSGRNRLFADFVHFTNEGSGIVAGVITRTLASNGLLSGAVAGSGDPRVSPATRTSSTHPLGLAASTPR